MMHCIGDNLKKKTTCGGLRFSSKPRIVRCINFDQSQHFCMSSENCRNYFYFVLESQNCGIFIKPIELIEPLLYQPSFTDLQRHIIVIICLCYGDLFGEVGSWGVINTRRKHMQNESNVEVPSLSDSKFCMK